MIISDLAYCVGVAVSTTVGLSAIVGVAINVGVNVADEVGGIAVTGADAVGVDVCEDCRRDPKLKTKEIRKKAIKPT